MSAKVEVFASPGWEAEVDTDWAEGLFAVFLRSARGRRRGPRGAMKPAAKDEVSDGVILLSVRKEDEAPDTTTPEAPAASAASDTRRARRPRAPREGTDPAAKAQGRKQSWPASAAKASAAKATAAKATAAPAHPVGREPRPTTLKTAVPPPPGDGRTRLGPPPLQRPTARPPASGKAMPEGDVAALLEEMATLIKYGHIAQVRAEFDRHLVAWPDDVLLRRRMVAFFRDRTLVAETIDGLFGLAAIHFDRREMTDMRQCLDEVLRLDPGSRRAKRMRELLDKRPGRPKPA